MVSVLLPWSDGPRRDDSCVVHAAVQCTDTGDAQRGLQRKPAVHLRLVHGDAERAHLVLADVIETEVQREPPRRRLEHEPRQALRRYLLPHVGGEVQYLQPLRDRELHDLRFAAALVIRQVECELPPHVRQLRVARAHDQLPRVERAARSVADPAIGLHDGLARVEPFAEPRGDDRQHAAEESLVVVAELEGVAVRRESVHEVAREVRLARDAALAVEGEPAGVQPHDRLGACAPRRPALRVRGGGLLRDAPPLVERGVAFGIPSARRPPACGRRASRRRG